MNELISLAEEKHSYLFSKPFKRPSEELWLKSATGHKVIWCNDYIEKIDPNYATIIGGICGTKATSLIEMDILNIKNEEGFRKWHLSWYPRIDQLHDSVGIPPKVSKHLVYIFEDSTHAQRIVNIRKNWDLLEVQDILKQAHIQQGQKILENWLRINGYRGTISCLFLSDLEKEIEVGIRIACNAGFKNESKNNQIRKLMYTSIWPSIMGISGQALIYEPIHYIDRHHQKYNTFLDNVGILSFIPYLSKDYPLDQIPHEKVANLINWKNFINEKPINYRIDLSLEKVYTRL